MLLANKRRKYPTCGAQAYTGVKYWDGQSGTVVADLFLSSYELGERGFVNAVMNCSAPQETGKCFTTWKIIRFPGTTLFYEVN